jgi:hypothetical protein
MLKDTWYAEHLEERNSRCGSHYAIRSIRRSDSKFTVGKLVFLLDQPADTSRCSDSSLKTMFPTSFTLARIQFGMQAQKSRRLVSKCLGPSLPLS